MAAEKSVLPETLLVAIDGSPDSQNSARAAVKIAQKKDLSIHGLFIVGARPILEGDHHFQAELEIEAKSATSDELMNDFKAQGNQVLDWLERLCFESGVPVETDMLFGGISEMILREARHFRFLAIGRRGHVRNNTPSMLGEHFQLVVPHLHEPILIGGAKTTNFSHIYLILTDRDEAVKILKWAEMLQKAFSSKILLSIHQDGETYPHRQMWAYELTEKSNLVDYQWITDPTHSGSEILHTAVEHEVDLILMEGYRRIALGLWLEKHPIDDVLTNSEITALVV
jgi:nucleotide-binding universal stress UspA family protein